MRPKSVLLLMLFVLLQPSSYCEKSVPERWQQLMKCASHPANSPPEEWMMHHNLTPSDVHAVKAELIQVADDQGSTKPILKVSWNISVDGSIHVLKGTMITLREIGNFGNVQAFRCMYTDFTGDYTGHLAEFSFSGFTVNPSIMYEISAYNIPTANIGEDQPSKSIEFTTPGSLWDPNITTCTICELLEMNFTTGKNGKYDIYLYTCSTNDIESCNDVSVTSITEDKEVRKMMKFNMTGKISKYLLITISPYFHACGSDCNIREKMVDMSKKCGECIEFPEKATKTDMVPYIIAVTSSICWAILVAMVYFMYRYGKMKTLHSTVPPARVKVLLVYPSDKEVFQNVALAFAEFLHTDCLCEVALDLWQMRNIAEMGPVQWLSQQKQIVDKVIFLCLNKTTMQSSSYLDGSNHTDCSSDMYSLALNLFCSDIKHNSSLQKYMVVSFDEISSEKDIPLVLTACSKYSFMKSLKQFCKDLHNISGCRVFPSVNSVILDCKYSSKQTVRLNDVIHELKTKAKTFSTVQMKEDCLIEIF
ncbi:interleukin-17 receptor B isoform X2 [Protopterus annectens]|uniref:interleukin-17 receptor B isoform X2 n=1 Tax=Protopterus annectens TaxID=7888 RepID=UPI001CF9FCDA|nr:interleukin-17 receptor B isoform X2 [Protopterus annectens]